MGRAHRRLRLGLGVLPLLSVQDGQSLLRFFPDGSLDLGKARQLLPEVLLLQHHQETLGPRHDGRRPRHVHQDSNLSEEGARLELGVGGLAVAGRHRDGATYEPIHGTGFITFGDDVVVRRVHLRPQVRADGGQEGLGRRDEKREGADAVQKIQRHAGDRRGRQRRRAHRFRWVGFRLEVPQQRQRLGDPRIASFGHGARPSASAGTTVVTPHLGGRIAIGLPSVS